MPFEFKAQHDFDLHIALEVEHAGARSRCSPRARPPGIETRGISDHGFIDSIYFRDPNGYVIELTAKRPGHDARMDPARNEARAVLEHWQARQARVVVGALTPTVDVPMPSRFAGMTPTAPSRRGHFDPHRMDAARAAGSERLFGSAHLPGDDEQRAAVVAAEHAGDACGPRSRSRASISPPSRTRTHRVGAQGRRTRSRPRRRGRCRPDAARRAAAQTRRLRQRCRRRRCRRR